MEFIEKIKLLPEDVKKNFTSNDSRLELERSCFMYEIKDEDISKISGPIGLIFVGDEHLENLPAIISHNIHVNPQMSYGIAYEINKRIFNRFPRYFKSAPGLLSQWEKQRSYPHLSQEDAWQKVLQVEPWILEEEREKEQEQKRAEAEKKAFLAQIDRISIEPALKKYPHLGEQLLTNSHIKLQNLPDPARPSIKNWIADYTFVLGFEKHTPVERGTYLFQNENSRNLSEPERQKLSQILKSYDEETPLTINSRTEQIIFGTEPASPTPAEKPPLNQAKDNSYFSHLKNFSPETPAPARSETFQTPTENTPPVSAENNNTNLQFSSPQKFSAEKKFLQPKIAPMRITPIRKKEIGSLQEDTRTLAKNVVNLREN